MSYRLGRDAVDGYVWLDDPSLTLSAGLSYAREAEPDDPPPPPRRPVGFAPPPRVAEPQLWEGDQA